MRRSVPIETAALGATAAAALTLYLLCFEPKPSLDRSLHRAIGQTLAKETLALLPPDGRVIVITRDPETFRQPAVDVLLRSFRQELSRASVAPPTLQVLQTDPLRPIDVPSGDFFECIRKSGPNHVIVSLLGPPLLAPEQRSRLGKIQPKVVAFCPGNISENVDLRQLFQAGLLHASIVSRVGPAAASTSASQRKRDFDELYQVLRAKEISTVSSLSGIGEEGAHK